MEDWSLAWCWYINCIAVVWPDGAATPHGHRTASLQTLTYKGLKFAVLSLFCCCVCVCEHVVANRMWQHWKVLDFLLQCPLLPKAVCVGSSILSACNYSVSMCVAIFVELLKLLRLVIFL